MNISSGFSGFMVRRAQHAVLGFLLLIALPVAATAGVINKRIASSADDAEQNVNGSVSLTSSDLELVLDGGGNQVVGIRYTNLDIPIGAVIDNAYVQFRTDEVNTVATNLAIRGEYSDSATVFSTSAFDISARPLTAASVAWTPPAWTVVGAEGADQRTPDLKAVIQEIVDLPGWRSGNNLALIITGTGERTAEAFDGDAGPLLHVDYSGGSPNPEIDTWTDLDIRFDGLHAGVDTVGSRLFVSLGAGFASPANYTATLLYAGGENGYGISLNNEPVVPSGSAVNIPDVYYGKTVPVTLYQNDVPLENYTLVFTNLPVVSLNAETIVDEPKSPGTFRLVSGAFAQDIGLMQMGIEFRGETSQQYPKKSFNLEIVDDDDPTSERNITPLGLRRDGDWLMDATYRDTSFVRNIISMDIFSAMRPYAFLDTTTGAPRGRPVIRGRLAEVILNEYYHGVFVFQEKLDRKQLNLDEIEVPEDALGNELWNQVDFSNPDNGSVIYKADKNNADMYPLDDVSTQWEQEYPDADDITYFTPLEELIAFVNNSSDAEFVSQVGQIVDIDSAVDFWLLTNLTMNRDSLKKNYFLVRNKSEKWFFLPWDNDATFGMLWDGSPYTTTSWWDPQKNNLIRRLSELTGTGFNAKAKTRWTELRGTIFTEEAIMARFDAYFADAVPITGEAENARTRNRLRWPESGGAGVNNPELATREYIRNWLVGRLAFLDVKIAEQPVDPPVCEDTGTTLDDATPLNAVASAYIDPCTGVCHLDP